MQKNEKYLQNSKCDEQCVNFISIIDVSRKLRYNVSDRIMSACTKQVGSGKLESETEKGEQYVRYY